MHSFKWWVTPILLMGCRLQCLRRKPEQCSDSRKQIINLILRLIAFHASCWPQSTILFFFRPGTLTKLKHSKEEFNILKPLCNHKLSRKKKQELANFSMWTRLVWFAFRYWPALLTRIEDNGYKPNPGGQAHDFPGFCGDSSCTLMQPFQQAGVFLAFKYSPLQW